VFNNSNAALIPFWQRIVLRVSCIVRALRDFSAPASCHIRAKKFLCRSFFAISNERLIGNNLLPLT
jgi:hypothetical protein